MNVRVTAATSDHSLSVPLNNNSLCKPARFCEDLANRRKTIRLREVLPF
jgi:hypothetical protein